MNSNNPQLRSNNTFYSKIYTMLPRTMNCRRSQPILAYPRESSSERAALTVGHPKQFWLAIQCDILLILAIHIPESSSSYPPSPQLHNQGQSIETLELTSTLANQLSTLVKEILTKGYANNLNNSHSPAAPHTNSSTLISAANIPKWRSTEQTYLHK